MQRHRKERRKKQIKKETTNVLVVVRIRLSKTNVQRCQGQRAQRIAKRCDRYVEKKVLIRWDDLRDAFFNIIPI